HLVGPTELHVDHGELLIAAVALLLGAVDVVVDVEQRAVGRDREVGGTGRARDDLHRGAPLIVGAQHGDVVAALVEHGHRALFALWGDHGGPAAHAHHVYGEGDRVDHGDGI